MQACPIRFRESIRAGWARLAGGAVRRRVTAWAATVLAAGSLACAELERHPPMGRLGALSWLAGGLPEARL